MASLTNPVEEQNIVNRFADYVVATANSGISWGTNSVPFAEFSTAYFGGTTGGKSIGINGSAIYNDPIDAGTIYHGLVLETYQYTRIRNLRARLNVTGGGGNTGTRPTKGVIYDATKVAHMNTDYRTGISVANNSVSVDVNIDSSNLEGFFNNLRAAYNSARGWTTTITIDVCHASCHSSCHGSRGRR